MIMDDLTFLTVCKGRLEFLKQTIPGVVNFEGASSVVVDYSCPDGTADWLAQEHSAVHCVKVPNADVFEKTKALNIGAKEIKTKYLCVTDADIINFAKVA